jgi:GTP-binding protein
VDFDDFYRMRIADVPGLVAGASDNVGLGHRFLKHIERNHVLVFILDMRSLFCCCSRARVPALSLSRMPCPLLFRSFLSPVVALVLLLSHRCKAVGSHASTVPPLDAYHLLRQELAAFNVSLLQRPSVIVANKVRLRCARGLRSMWRCRTDAAPGSPV